MEQIEHCWLELWDVVAYGVEVGVFMCCIRGIIFGMILCVCWESGVGNNPLCVGAC